MPVLEIIEDDFVAPDHGEWSFLGDDSTKSILHTVVRATARIEFVDDEGEDLYATGFLVGERLLTTNRHVAERFCGGVGSRGLSLVRNAFANFKVECGGRDPERVEVDTPLLIHPHWDWALLSLKSSLPGRPNLRFDVRPPEAIVGQAIAVVGHPKRTPSVGGANHQTRLLRCRGGNVRSGVKRIATGRLKPRESINDHFGNDCLVLKHTASTLPSNSGSPIVDLSTGTIVGIHVGGRRYLEPNDAVPGHELAKDARVVSKGVAFSGTINATDDWEAKWLVADSDDGLDESIS
ncbi:MAG: serine protease [Planctomycetota bacterium]